MIPFLILVFVLIAIIFVLHRYLTNRKGRSSRDYDDFFKENEKK